MAWWNKLKRETRSGLASPSEWMFDALGASATPSGQRVTVDKALGLSPVYAAVSIISEQVGQLPFKVYRRLDDGQRVEARNHNAWRLLNHRPNSSTPAGRFWSTVTAHLLLHGNAFIEKVRGTGGGVEELRILSPQDVTVKWWPKIMDKSFVIQPPIGGGERRELDSSEVLHIMNMSLDGIVGLSVVQACRSSFGTALARDEFEGVFYDRGAVFSGRVEMDGQVKSPEAIKRLSESLKALYAGSGKAHGVPVFEDGAKWMSTGSPLRDLQFVESQNMTRTDIAVMFKLPPNYLGGSSGDSLTYATVEMNQTQFAMHAISPVTHTIAQAISQDPSLLPQAVFDAEFVLEGMLRGDMAGRAAFYQTMTAIKALHPDEVRAKENLPPLTPSQKKDLAPPAPPMPEPGDQQQVQSAPPTANVNGNGEVTHVG
jgi:HK97 family phage portal protein